jgi:hypothetical protein
MTITVVGPKECPKSSEFTWFLNTTSRSPSEFGTRFSPFLLGPVPLYKGAPTNYSMTMENAWQFSKVYKKYIDENGDPSSAWIEWARKGFRNPRAFRYPMGKGSSPEYSFWNGEKLSYIEARKKIYIPLYKQGIKTHRVEEFKKLCDLYEKERRIMLWCYDGYNRKLFNMSVDDVVNSPDRSMGHSFVLEQLLLEHFAGEL